MPHIHKCLYVIWINIYLKFEPVSMPEYHSSWMFQFTVYCNVQLIYLGLCLSQRYENEYDLKPKILILNVCKHNNNVVLH